MRWITLICFIAFYSELVTAQVSQTLKGKVSFDRDNTEWIATVVERDTVSVLFKMQFKEASPDILPPNGVYQIVYSPSLIEFNNIKQKKSYTFSFDNLAITGRKNIKHWSVIGIGRMNPVCFPISK